MRRPAPLVCALRCLLAFKLCREAPSGEREFVNCSVECDFLVGVEIKEADPTFQEVLDDETRAEGVAAKAGLVTNDDDVELLVVGCVEERDETGALFELGPRDGIVEVHVLGLQRAAILRDVPLALFGLDFH